MALKNGVYEIRFVPPHIHFPIIGGLYASGEGINAPVRALPLGTHGEKHWNVDAVPGQQGVYTITYPVPVLPKTGWGIREDRSHTELVFLTPKFSEWLLVEVDAKNSVYEIRERTEAIGVIHAVTEQDGLVMVKAYPVVPNVSPPRWQIAFVEK